ncbi:anti-sigma factor family protein [Spirillospora sp. NBC_01491]|uniref:anti-sigma factor family protein n=1 Tax=Spirillospora sp. NBC_01491 TaxID=2976007 RepID=UPI002E31D5E1|nr:anti-sigma factor [Spirillospora sp. NBC_01491]
MTDCAEARTSLGVYVLGAIDPAERSRLEAHLETCPVCRDELAGLAGLPALLGRVDEAQLTQVAGPEPELLEGLLARAAAGRRPAPARWLRVARPWWPLVAVACLLLVVGGLLGGLVTAKAQGHRAAPPSPASAVPAPGGSASGVRAGRTERLAAEDAKTGVRGYVLLHERQWGTSLQLFLAGAKKGSHCRWSVIARDGRREPLGSWYVPYGKGYGEYPASTMFRRDQLFSFEIVSLDGQPLLTIPA